MALGRWPAVGQGIKAPRILAMVSLLRRHGDASGQHHCCPNSDQRRGYILVSLESFSDTLFEYYKDRGARTEDAGEYFEGEPPEMEISIDALMRRFAEGH